MKSRFKTNLSILRCLAFAFVLPCIVLMIAGCNKSKSSEADGQVASKNESADNESTEAAESEAADKSVMDHASDLIEQAKDVTSDTASSASEWAKDVYQKSLDTAESTTNKMSDSLKGLYKKAVESGTTTAKSTKDWVEEDIGKMGAWVYTSRTVSTEEDAQATVAMLNEMGREKWECFWVEKQGTATTLYFKKSPRSYISNIPFKDLVKMFPGLGSDN